MLKNIALVGIFLVSIYNINELNKQRIQIVTCGNAVHASLIENINIDDIHVEQLQSSKCAVDKDLLITVKRSIWNLPLMGSLFGIFALQLV